ncbi:MAG: amino acid permease [bacterium]|nr:amino acid permease [bacterium]
MKRIIGMPTALLLGMGVAIGSGIFRTPGDIAASLQTPGLVILAWVFGGLFVLMAGMVTAELATRYPRAGGEYVYLREAYGDFVAFFFGWSYTFFIVGGGAATIARAFGDFGCELLACAPSWSGPIAAVAVVLVTAVNAAGLRAGANFQNLLTVLKVLALLAVIVIGFGWGREPIDWLATPANRSGGTLLIVFAAGVIPVLWAYDGTTDSVKLAEEIRDVRRALPRALIGSAVALTLLYALVNIALLRIMPAAEMAGLASVPGEAMRRVFGPGGRMVMLVVAMLVFLGALSSTVLATIRVAFALARDGLTFRFLAGMSPNQAPVPALVVVAGFSVLLVMTRTFAQVLTIYFLASAILFGLSYGSLIVFRVRERKFPAEAYRCPAGVFQASVLIAIQLALAAGIVLRDPREALYTVSLLGFFGGLYFIWRRQVRPADGPG